MDEDFLNRLALLDALRRAEALAQEIARTACRRAVSGQAANLEEAKRALDTSKRAREFRQQFEQQLADPLANA